MTATIPCVSGALAVALNLPLLSVLLVSIVSRLKGGIASEADSYKNDISELGIG